MPEYLVVRIVITLLLKCWCDILHVSQLISFQVVSK
jgi:hypothetical protein